MAHAAETRAGWSQRDFIRSAVLLWSDRGPQPLFDVISTLCTICPRALACVGVHENYQAGNGIGHSLVEAAEKRAADIGAKELFVLTTQTRDWFVERGFKDAGTDHRPAEKQQLYNWQRNSAVLIKNL